jgi:hypothetical protein
MDLDCLTSRVLLILYECNCVDIFMNASRNIVRFLFEIDFKYGRNNARCK